MNAQHAATIARWRRQPLLAFDLETSGVDVHADRIVTASIVRVRPDTRPASRTWLVDPGIDIPTEAAAVHGWTTERIKADPTAVSPGQALFEIAGILALHMGRGTPVVAFNAAYDFTLLEAENRRHGVDTLTARLGKVAPVIDPMVLDKQVDPYRKAACDCGCGATSKKLVDICAHYGVTLADAHSSAGDALAAARLVPAMVARFPGMFAGYTVGGLHDAQVVWRRKQQLDFRSYRRRKGLSYADIHPEWPILPTPGVEAVAS